jgi:type I restriction enzyme S subunit
MMSKWDIVRLGDVCKIVNGYAFDSKQFNIEKKGMPLIRIRDVVRGYTETFTTEQYDEAFMICENNLLIGMDGEFNISKWKSENALLNQRVCRLIENENFVIGKYLLYCLPKKLKEIEDETPFVTVKHLSSKKINEIQIPLPPLAVQQKIADTLDRAAVLIEKRKAQITKLDLLVKSQFIKMFGDPRLNSKSFPVTDFVDVVKLQRGFDLPVQLRMQAGKIPVYGSNGILDYHNEAKMTSGIITGRSGTIGKVYCVFGKCWPLNTTLFSIDTNGNDITYLANLLEHFDLTRFVEGSGVPTLNRNIVHKEKIINASLNLQNHFSTFVHATEKSKAEMQRGLHKLELLYKSLVQKCFNNL